MGIPAVIKPYSQTLSKFSKNSLANIGKVQFRVPYANNRNIELNLYVGDIDVPLLISIDSMDKYSIYVNNVDNLLVCKDPVWSCPVISKNGHI